MVAFILILNNPIIAQPQSPEITSTMAHTDRNDDNGKRGLTGLVELLVLMKLKKNEKVSNYTTTNTPQKR